MVCFIERLKTGQEPEVERLVKAAVLALQEAAERIETSYMHGSDFGDASSLVAQLTVSREYIEWYLPSPN